ncbi:hypothetical protein BDZ91DRAFT_797207 [Kalaharituber pfeilii]|nr:hypothetical protein BDZ91DRAFT_797207 [Kalaharituber pfeilii]
MFSWSLTSPGSSIPAGVKKVLESEAESAGAHYCGVKSGGVEAGEGGGGGGGAVVCGRGEGGKEEEGGCGETSVENHHKAEVLCIGDGGEEPPPTPSPTIPETQSGISSLSALEKAREEGMHPLSRERPRGSRLSSWPAQVRKVLESKAECVQACTTAEIIPVELRVRLAVVPRGKGRILECNGGGKDGREW